jgi:membrane protein YqaA with SNARE-associated domain
MICPFAVASLKISALLETSTIATVFSSQIGYVLGLFILLPRLY